MKTLKHNIVKIYGKQGRLACRTAAQDRGYRRKNIAWDLLSRFYKKRLNLQEAQFTFIDHEDAMVAADDNP